MDLPLTFPPAPPAGSGDGRSDAERASDALAPVLRWLACHPDPVPLALACPDHPATVAGAGGPVVRLAHCVTALPASGFLELVLAGAREVRLLGTGCACATGTAGTLSPSAAEAGRLLAAAARPGVVRTGAPTPRRGPFRRRMPASPVLDADRLPPPRRALMTLGGGAIRTLHARPGSERGRLLTALDRLGLDHAAAARLLSAPDHPPVRHDLPAPAADPDPPAVATGAVLRARGCTGCAVCVRACPADALDLTRGDGTVTLVQDVRACTDCGRCTALCPAGALTRTGSRGWEDVLGGGRVGLCRVAVGTCRRCRATFGRSPGDPADLCPVCAYRRARPFGAGAPEPARP